MKLFLLILAVFYAGVAAANNNDQALRLIEVTIDNQTCISDIAMPDDDNCNTADGNRGECEGIANCVCSKPDKHIEWQGTTIKNFSVYFYGDSSPFNDNCSLDSNNQGKLKCRIKAAASGNYDYGIKVAGCADYDPRIIIK